MDEALDGGPHQHPLRGHESQQGAEEGREGMVRHAVGADLRPATVRERHEGQQQQLVQGHRHPGPGPGGPSLQFRLGQPDAVQPVRAADMRGATQMHQGTAGVAVRVHHQPDEIPTLLLVVSPTTTVVLVNEDVEVSIAQFIR